MAEKKNEISGRGINLSKAMYWTSKTIIYAGKASALAFMAQYAAQHIYVRSDDYRLLIAGSTLMFH